MKKLMLVLVAATAGTLFAADDDLICFYPFTDGEPGTRPATLTTYIGVEGLPAAKYVKKGQDKGSFFDSDVPSKYVFPSKSATVPLTSNYQSIICDETGGCEIDFPDLATRLSKGGRPFTIEMFFKPGKQVTYHTMIAFQHGANEAGLYIPGTGNKEGSGNDIKSGGVNAALFCPFSNRKTFDHRDGTYGPYFYQNGLNYRSFEDGHWHHVAIVYDGVEELTLYWDYLSAASITAVGGELAEEFPLKLSSGVTYGKFAAFRATAAALSPKDFIYASNEPNRALPETRMYLRFETEGASAGDPAIGYFKNDAATATGMDYDYAIAAFRTNLVDGVWVTNRLQYCDQVQKGTVFSGTQRVGKNRMSIRNRPQIDREAYDGTCGFPRLMKSYFNQLDGDFTVECFLKLDYMNTSRDTTIFGQQNYEYYKKTGEHYTTWGLTMSTSGVLSYYVQDARSTVKSNFKPLNDYKWHHFALTYTKDKRKLTLYVDGEEMPSKTLDFDLDVSSQPINFGSEMNYQVFNGCFDEIRITRRLLAPSEFLYQKDLGMMILLK